MTILVAPKARSRRYMSRGFLAKTHHPIESQTDKTTLPTELTA
ncbi:MULTISPECIES: hypothetical protein [unclassified Streptomyces]|nr:MULTISPECIES: hypothetical protein [unclassified Streptomyces]MCZ4100152.1 hypothetical protein [Streptomyces sp. H39-C1]